MVNGVAVASNMAAAMVNSNSTVATSKAVARTGASRTRTSKAATMVVSGRVKLHRPDVDDHDLLDTATRTLTRLRYNEERAHCRLLTVGTGFFRFNKNGCTLALQFRFFFWDPPSWKGMTSLRKIASGPPPGAMHAYTALLFTKLSLFIPFWKPLLLILANLTKPLPLLPPFLCFFLFS